MVITLSRLIDQVSVAKTHSSWSNETINNTIGDSPYPGCFFQRTILQIQVYNRIFMWCFTNPDVLYLIMYISGYLCACTIDIN